MNLNNKNFQSRKNKGRNKNKNYGTAAIDTNYYAKFKRVELVANGSIVLCKATAIDGVEEIYDWNRQGKRDLVKANTLPDAEIIVNPSVPENKGWDYGRSN